MAQPNPDRVRILGIETSCDDTGVAVTCDGNRVLSNRVSSQVEMHRPYGGVVPEIASRAHIETLQPLVSCCLDESKLTFREIDTVAVTYGPGLAGCLLVGVSFAKALAYGLRKPLIGINHLEAHVYTVALDTPPERQPPFPHLSLLVSGGHTALYRVDGWSHLTMLGRTQDDAAGEAFDKVASILGLGYPGGPAIEQAARGADPAAISLPRTLLGEDSLNFSFSGIKTAVLYLCFGQNAAETDRKRPSPTEQAEVAAAFQEAVVDVLVEKCRRALAQTGLSQLAVSGGVAANSRLREKLLEAAEREGWAVVFPPKNLCTDNAVMVAALGCQLLRKGEVATLEVTASAEGAPPR